MILDTVNQDLRYLLTILVPFSILIRRARARSAATDCILPIISLSSTPVWFFVCMNRTSDAAEASSYRVTIFLAFPTEGIPIGLHRSLCTRSSVFCAPLIILSSGFRLYIVYLFSNHDFRAVDTRSVRFSRHLTSVTVLEVTASGAWPKLLCQLGRSTAMKGISATSDLLFGFRSISYRTKLPSIPIIMSTPVFFAVINTSPDPFEPSLKVT